MVSKYIYLVGMNVAAIIKVMKSFGVDSVDDGGLVSSVYGFET